MVEYEILWHRGIDASINRVPTVVKVSRPDAIIDMIMRLVKAEQFDMLQEISEDGRGRNFRVTNNQLPTGKESPSVVVSKDVWDTGIKHGSQKRRR